MSHKGIDGTVSTPSQEVLPLQEFRIELSPGGETALLYVGSGDQTECFQVRYSQMGWLQREVALAGQAMTERLLRPLDRGADALSSLVLTASRPVMGGTVISIDRSSDETCFILQFSNHAPLAICLSEDSLQTLIAMQRSARQKLLN